ncbi:MAG: acyl carrier protein [Clostridia bacterium]|nr:acyl carrier protein [Clostridia bacterium]
MIFEKVVDMITDYSDIAPDEIKKDSTFEDLELDSLDVVELVMAVEDEFGVTVEINDGLKTVGDVVEYIEENM